MHKHQKAALIAIVLASVAFALPAGAQTTPAAKESAAASENPRERFGDGMRERMAERHAQIDHKLTTEQVRDIVEGRLAMAGNPNLKVGKVTAKAEGVVAVDLVTKTGALVSTREISTRTGLPVEIEARRQARAEAVRERGDRSMRGGMGGRFTGTGGARRDLNLTADQAKKLAEARLIMMGNPNLRVGAVKEKDADTITIDIVAADNSLVVQREIDRHTGRRKRS